MMAIAAHDEIVGDLLTDKATPLAHSRKLHVVGYTLTACWLIAMGAYAAAVWPLMLQMKPDTFATFLSGVFAPVAFLWLVLGFMQQGDELKNSARALMLQSEELRASVEQQKQLVEVSREQIAADAASRASAEKEADRAAQPILTLTAKITGRSGDYRDGRLQLQSVGPDCIDVELRLSDGRKLERPVLGAGSSIEVPLKYGHPDEIEPIEVGVQYTDHRGNRRQQLFFVPTIIDNDFGKNFSKPARMSPPSPVTDV